MNKPVCLCYYPTKILLIDDNVDFLQSMRLSLEKNLHCQTYSDPIKAYASLKTLPSSTFIQRCCVEPITTSIDHLSFNLDIRKIHQELHNPARFNDIAVIVIDYHMPGMDGLSLSRQIKTLSPYYRIILLTGEADQDLAINAFNEGIIDHFIKKDTAHLSSKLLTTIKSIEHQYFKLLSQGIIDKEIVPSLSFDALSDPKICHFFHTLCQENQIIEYYLLDAYGNYLLVDSKGKIFWLALLSYSELQEFLNFALIEKGAPTVIEALKSQEKIPFFYTEEDLMSPPSQWEKYLYPAHCIEGEQRYFYALVPSKPEYEEALGPFISYQTYLDESI